jgi:hypothetical protein
MSGVERGNDWLLLEIDAAILHLEFNLNHLEQSRELVCVLRRDDALAPHIVIDRHHEETVLLAHHLHRVDRNVFLKRVVREGKGSNAHGESSTPISLFCELFKIYRNNFSKSHKNEKLD